MDYPWSKYSVGRGREFSSVSHVTHVENAISIVRSGVLRPQLVYDASKLRKRRILVLWLSPNDWADGYRYGNISFNYNLADLIADKHFYWVEDIKHTPTSPTACRILITDVERPADKHLVEYDPHQGDGPWLWSRRTNKHFRNPAVTLELMLECELLVRECREVAFVKHHEDQCCIDWRECAERGHSSDTGGSRFVAGIVAGNLNASMLGMSDRKSGKKRKAGFSLESACWRIQRRLCKQACNGTVSASGIEAKALARAAMSAFYRDDQDEFSCLCSLFKSSDELCIAVETLIKGGFGVSSCFDW